MPKIIDNTDSRNANCIYIASNFADIDSFDARWFRAEFLKQRDLITSSAIGRGEVHLFRLPDGKEGVLRHYYRGGLMGKLNPDRFLIQKAHRTRVWEEIAILEKLVENDIKVPIPLFGKISNHSLFYRADIITAKIPDATEFHALLQLQDLSDDLWHKIGVTLGNLHRIDVRHDDINVKNIMLSNHNDIYLLDFDKCKQVEDGVWKDDNLVRFKRSLIKQQSLCEQYYFNETKWQCLLDGYWSV